jgi:exopolysaccharide biosynthesis polyprenyl glycosylphosphotransferase
VRGLLMTTGLALGTYLIAFFFAPRGLLPRLFILYFIAGALAFCLSWRLLYIGVFFSPYFQRRVLVVGAGWAGETIVRAVTKSQPRQYVVVGLIDDDHHKHGQVVGGVPVLGGCENLLTAIQSNQVSEVVLAISGEIQGATFKALLDCQAHGVPVVRMASLYEQITGYVPLEHLDADWVITSFMDRAHSSRWSQLAQRGLDIAIALVGLLGLGVFGPLIAAAIWLDSPGPILYRQTRLGQGGRPFELLKFRTMVPNAEADGQARWASHDDERVTRVGRFLRRTRLDEAPQFWNILKGEMGLAGPRPERPEFISALERHIPFYRARLMVKPGLTGWAQVNFGYGDSIEDMFVKLQYDLYYIKHRSLWLDLQILIRTVAVVLRFQGQ